MGKGSDRVRIKYQEDQQNEITCKLLYKTTQGIWLAAAKNVSQEVRVKWK